MKKIVLFILVIILGFFIWKFNFFQSKSNKVENSSLKSLSDVKITPQKDIKSYVFVPYWTVSKNMNFPPFDSVIYFGLNVNENGIDTSNNGYQNLDTFIENAKSSKEKILAVTITNSDMALDVIKSVSLQNKIIDKSIEVAKNSGFDGVLLDFETSAFGFESTTNKISSFYERFSSKVRSNNLLFYSTLFGDTYFQARAYDVLKIGKVSDKVLIMAYDFTKSKGNPGPNFPLNDANSVYGYDFSKMVADFQKDVPNEKLVVVLGYFGYDWEVNSKNEAVSAGMPLSTNQIEDRFVNSCKFKNCQLVRSKTTLEPSITYIDSDNNKHIVWYEDEVSIEKKKEFLKSRGILETGVWAYSYN